MNDKTTKALLLAIALGLWANVATSLIQPKALYAQQPTTVTVAGMADLAHDVKLITVGLCLNSKVC